MFIGNRLFPYPVLTEGTDDYPQSQFIVRCDPDDTPFNGVKLAFHMHADDPVLAKLIQTGEAVYAVHAECTATSYRKLYTTQDPDIEIAVDEKDVRGRVEFLALILAQKRITRLTNPNWNEDYEGLSFSFQPGNILGYQNVGALNITKHIEEFDSADSIFNVCSVLTEDSAAVKIELNGPRILLQLPKSQYLQYTAWMKNPNTQQLANGVVIFPALVYVLTRIGETDNPYDEYGERSWFNALDKAMQGQGTSLAEQLDQKDVFELAQDIMQSPVAQALTDMENLAGGWE
ncbi:hypothetical protein [Pseudoramibacter sp.]|jgi:hypothetical protein|uniref:hypothetical protein n=1 Tax=Pseudoramibacter sp. TaxID=2034862 RepID=UPI0025E29D44|nr:hypothetical protein [Pseudoramibacter sp.]MCH4071824.1 hypothetical protein [Pseudoramibacter sp.]MCH4105592.1 hypothetical protein [Pseudoramibacter sp.]